MSAQLIALAVVAYFAIGAVFAGIDARACPYDHRPVYVSVLWPAFVLVLAGYCFVVVASWPFRALYRAVRGKP